MAKYTCDACGEEPGTFMVSNTDNGQTQALGVLCLCMLGLTTLYNVDIDALDAATKALGYQLSKAERDKRKAAEVPEFDVNRPIATVTETAPRPPGDESTSSSGEESASQLVDKPIRDEAAYWDGLPAELGLRDPNPDRILAVPEDDPPPY
jgi:hypothetical protein